MLPPTDVMDVIDNSGGAAAYQVQQSDVDVGSTQCSRPQMAWHMYEQLFRIAASRHYHQDRQRQNEEQLSNEINAKKIWLAAFTGCQISYEPGVAAGVAERLYGLRGGM